MRIGPAALAATAALLASTAASAQACPPFSGISVGIEPPIFDVTEHNDRSSAQLTQIMRGPSTSHSVKGRVIGLTSYPVSSKASGGFRTMTRGSTVCLYPHSLEVSIQVGVPTMRVDVASEYPKGSCQYDAILEHEHTHVRLTNVTLQDATPVLRTEMEDFLRKNFPITGGDAAALQARAMAMINPKLSAEAAKVQRKIAEANALIDTQENYTHESRTNCGGRW